jgi:hypothetical protein
MDDDTDGTESLDTVNVVFTEEEHVQKIDNCWAFAIASLVRSAEDRECKSCKSRGRRSNHESISEKLTKRQMKRSSFVPATNLEIRDHILEVCYKHNDMNDHCRWKTRTCPKEPGGKTTLEWDEFLPIARNTLSSGAPLLICFIVSEDIRLCLYHLSKTSKGQRISINDCQNFPAAKDFIGHSVELVEISSDNTVKFKDWNESGDESGVICLSLKVLKKYLTLTFAATIGVKPKKSSNEVSQPMDSQDIILAGGSIALVIFAYVVLWLSSK